MKRLHMESNRHGVYVQAEDTREGRETLRIVRLADDRFKGCRIREILQLHPDDVALNQIYRRV